MRIEPTNTFLLCLLWGVGGCNNSDGPPVDQTASNGGSAATTGDAGDGGTTDAGASSGSSDSGDTSTTGGDTVATGSQSGSGSTSTTTGAEVPPDVGFGILGDSNSDEYRADDNRGGAYADVTFNWMEQLVLFRDLDFGSWGRWGGSRRTGYEYNWARSGARADDLIGQGQAAGVAGQVSEGLVDYVYIEIGANDFHTVNGTYLEIYDGSLSDQEVAAKASEIVTDVEQAVDTVLAADPSGVFLRTFGDPSLAPDTAITFPDAAGRARVSAAISEVNVGIAELATARPGLVIVDTNALAAELLGLIDENGMLMIGDELIDLIEAGDEPHHGRLGDSSGHAGTVISGVVANLMFIDPVNEVGRFGIVPFTDEEILSHAGL